MSLHSVLDASATRVKVLRLPEPMRSSCASAFCIATIASCVCGASGGRTPTASHVRLELALEARPFLGAEGAGKLEDGALGEPGLVGRVLTDIAGPAGRDNNRG